MSEKEQILDTEAWPNWPKLPMKKRRKIGMPDFGFITAFDVDAGKKITIYKGNVFRPKEALTDYETAEFDNLDALLTAGWVGD